MKRMKKSGLIPSIACITVGVALSLNAILAMMLSNIHIGHFLTLAMGAVLLACPILYKNLNNKIPTWAKVLFFILVGIAVFFMLFLLCYGTADSITYGEDAIIVLGAGIQGETPSENLRCRLERAIEYFKANPNAVIVVSGGKGPQEDITEALAMQQYLLKHGIPEQSIIKEERATSTYENFVFSKELLDAHFDGEYSVAFVTNGYHVYRAKALAEDIGYKGITYAHSETPWYAIIPSTARECLATVKMWIG